MENIINSIKTLFTTYGFRAATIIVATVVLVNLIKRPILKRAEATQARTGVEKSVVTRYISFLPVIVAFLIDFVWECVVKEFDVAGIDYGALLSSSLLYGALAVATYETIKKQLQAYAAKTAAKAEAVTPVKKEDVSPTPTEPVLASELTETQSIEMPQEKNISVHKQGVL